MNTLCHDLTLTHGATINAETFLATARPYDFLHIKNLSEIERIKIICRIYATRDCAEARLICDILDIIPTTED